MVIDESVILTCPNCGNKSPMKILNRYEKVSFPSFPYDDIQLHDIFEVFECPVCKGFHLYYTHWNTEESYFEGFDIYEEGQVLYPTTEKINLSSLPLSVKSAYESALKVRKIDAMVFLMALRRTLEMVCKENGEDSGQLHQKLNQLQQKGILPPLMGDISKVIKDFGNIAAHGDQVKIDFHVTEGIFSFTNKVLEYVYILPQEMKRARQEIEIINGGEED